MVEEAQSQARGERGLEAGVRASRASNLPRPDGRAGSCLGVAARSRGIKFRAGRHVLFSHVIACLGQVDGYNWPRPSQTGSRLPSHTKSHGTTHCIRTAPVGPYMLAHRHRRRRAATAPVLRLATPPRCGSEQSSRTSELSPVSLSSGTAFPRLPLWPELTAALSSLEKIAWVRLSDDTARFTVIPDMGSQVWACVSLH